MVECLTDALPLFSSIPLWLFSRQSGGLLSQRPTMSTPRSVHSLQMDYTQNIWQMQVSGGQQTDQRRQMSPKWVVLQLGSARIEYWQIPCRWLSEDLENRCYSDSDCQLATNNSICRPKDNTSDKESICVCKEDYVMSDDKLHCKPVIKTTGIAWNAKQS